MSCDCKDCEPQARLCPECGEDLGPVRQACPGCLWRVPMRITGVSYGRGRITLRSAVGPHTWPGHEQENRFSIEELLSLRSGDERESAAYFRDQVAHGWVISDAQFELLRVVASALVRLEETFPVPVVRLVERKALS